MGLLGGTAPPNFVGSANVDFGRGAYRTWASTQHVDAVCHWISIGDLRVDIDSKCRNLSLSAELSGKATNQELNDLSYCAPYCHGKSAETS
jgi:hypothetical protein